VQAAVYVSGGSSKTFGIKLNNITVSNRAIVNNGTSHTFNVMCGGFSSDNFGRTTSVITVGTTSTWNFVSNCADIGVDISTIARQDGTIIYNTNAALGTLASAGLVTCQGTAANSWRLMGDPTLRY
jgi:hypothetical protein